ncbi:hypothetical protein PsorP6_001587 [Peronosclerospora sorghi]|uniref:Uncharacterized protein n=1 Tax=Peronosclerospora sorghi TaxID=230839 RepID=A0ACC0WPA2_9STRA|nr:hypothetical protein PsorP6_001587 [Peronosclerospora sorghi]
MNGKFQSCPSQKSGARCQVRVYGSNCRNSIGCTLRTSIETEPAEPNQGSTDQYEGHVVWFYLVSMIVALTDYDCCDKSSKPTGNMNDSASGKIEGPHLAFPAHWSDFPGLTEL